MNSTDSWQRRVAERLRTSSSEAVVLERVARGGGETRWFTCRSPSQLQQILDELRPGSSVTFYFDGRIHRARYSEEASRAILRTVRESGEVLIGRQLPDGFHLDVELISGPLELAERTRDLDETSIVYFGTFPSRDDDGENAITVVLPDSDGVVRNHPH